MVQDVIVELGHPLEVCNDLLKDAAAAWRLQKGEAHVYVMLLARQDGNRLRITAPVLHLEGVADEARLFRRLLELNARALSSAAFSVEDGTVSIIAERTTIDLDRSEVLDLVKRVEDYAVAYDASLVKEFGGRVAGISNVPLLKLS
jgi:hypothetical protein